MALRARRPAGLQELHGSWNPRTRGKTQWQRGLVSLMGRHWEGCLTSGLGYSTCVARVSWKTHTKKSQSPFVQLGDWDLENLSGSWGGQGGGKGPGGALVWSRRCLSRKSKWLRVHPPLNSQLGKKGTERPSFQLYLRKRARSLHKPRPLVTNTPATHQHTCTWRMKIRPSWGLLLILLGACSEQGFIPGVSGGSDLRGELANWAADLVLLRLTFIFIPCETKRLFLD